MQTLSKPTRIVVIGAGAVGATTAYTLLLRNRADEIVLLDVNADKARGEALDMQHGRPFTGGSKVWAGDYSDCADADIVIVTAGVAQRPGETRQELLSRNVTIVRSVVEQVIAYNDHGILLMATNPVDVLSYVAWRVSGWPAERVIGSGTVLDSARFRFRLGQELGVDARSVHAHILGEHGDTEVAAWSKTNVAGVPVQLPEDQKQRIYTETRDAAYEIIRAKGSTSYAIALALDRICAAILSDEHAVLNVSTRLMDYHGISNLYMGVPCVVDRTGVVRIIDLPLTDDELTLLHRSAAELSKRIREVEALF
ncbi:MAG: L-lactate dehydrogenase [Alicyclobacillus herbarius]|uniref:L-lactate dehydrogenase n=1 Tax=Alicyclobacillus herbarius TaxID=122960 RepID=UPI00041D10FF|nr:L-lactate dehydrogenase [Alicyclobacillus herbarius]MCL6631975.1 L-lactate dehydrogenase [Alicyclobacillus herbarius]